MLSLLLFVVLLIAGAAFVLGAVAVLDGGGEPVAPAPAVTGGGLAHASVTQAGATTAADADQRAPQDNATQPPTYPVAS